MSDTGYEKAFVGAKIRKVRQERNLTQAAFAKALKISPSYLNQLEKDHRPVTARVLMELSGVFGVDIGQFSNDDADRIGADLREVLASPVLGGQKVGLASAKQLYRSAPELAAALLASASMNRKYEEKLQMFDASLGDDSRRGSFSGGAPLPYEEVRDFFHYRNNFIPELDEMAEQLDAESGIAGAAPFEALCATLESETSFRVVIERPQDDVEMIFQIDSETRLVALNGHLPISTQCFQLAALIGRHRHDDVMGSIVADANFSSDQAKQICRLALANYYAGALVMPYDKIREEAGRTRHDIERLQRIFGASFEQVCHRLSNLQKPGYSGVPFFFVRVDQAGNITKRHSATKFQFARFGGACPLWNVHESLSNPGQINVQIAETPDGVRYLSIARPIIKRSGQYDGFDRYYAVALGCEIHHAESIIYSDGIDLDSEQSITPIGVGCRICERRNCRQRAFPPIDRDLITDPNVRNFTPYNFT